MPTEDEFVDATREGLRIAASRGVVAIHDKDGWLGAPGIFQRVAERDGLTLRVWQSIPYERLPELEALGIHSGIGDDFLRIGYLKAFMDGTLGSQTAWMLDGSGVVITSGEELAEVIREGARLGWPVGVHAIGDRANREALDAFESTRDVWAPLGLRHRIEHAQCLAPEDVGRFAALGVACSVQFSHAPSDRDLAERFWPEQVDGAYAFRSLWDSGALVANGSDAPVEELDPLAGIRAGVLRTIDERPAWHPEQCLTIEEALVATCVNPAWLSGDERRRGKLLPGYLADLVVLSRDPLAVPAGRARDGRGRRDDGRRPLGAQPAALGLTMADRIAKSEGRRLFGSDPSTYDARAAGHSERVYDVLVARCGLGRARRVLEVGAGNGAGDTTSARPRRRSTRCARAGSGARRLSARRRSAGRVDVRVAALEDAELGSSEFDLAAAASSFHWVEEDVGLEKIRGALRPGGWWAMWWTLFGEGRRKDAFMQAVDPLLENLPSSPSSGLRLLAAGVRARRRSARCGARSGRLRGGPPRGDSLGGDVGQQRDPRALLHVLADPQARARAPARRSSTRSRAIASATSTDGSSGRSTTSLYIARKPT